MLFHINNSQLSIKNNPGSLWFYCTLICDWSRNLTPSCRPIRCKTKNNRDLVIRVFQLANDDVDPFFWLVAAITLIWVFWHSFWNESNFRFFRKSIENCSIDHESSGTEFWRAPTGQYLSRGWGWGGGGVGRLDSVTIKFTNPHRGASPFSLYFVLPYRPSIDW